MALTACLLCVVGLFSSGVDAFPYTAGGCDGGIAAVKESHVSDTAVTGTLADGGFALIVNNQYRLDPATPTYFLVGETYSLSIQGGPFRGILIRVEGEDVDAITMTAISPFRLSEVCAMEGAIGISHTESSDKTGLIPIGDIGVSSGQELGVDVTVVVSNNGQKGSEYYYDRYTLTSVDEVPSVVPQPDAM
jgi:hypothetical protein